MGCNLVVIRKHSLQANHEHHSVPALSKASRERVGGQLLGRVEGIKGIACLEHRMYGGAEACLERQVFKMTKFPENPE